jgi:nitrogen regulatory protein P-II 1
VSYLVVLVVDDIDYCPAVLNAWEEAGILGVTILNSTGLGRFKRAGLRDDLPLMPSLSDIFQSDEVQHRTLLAVVEAETMVDRMVAAAEGVIGDLDEPHTGFLFVVPVLKVYGMGKHRTDRSAE